MDRKVVIMYAGLVGLFLLEFFIFRTYVFRELLDYYPIGHDQVGYLSVAYKAYEMALTKGLLNIFSSEFALPTSIFFIPQGVLSFLFFDATRFSALLVNFFYFGALQLVLLYVVRYVTGRWSFSVLALGLLLVMGMPYMSVGGLDDFRIDFSAMCLYGVFISCVIRSDLFLYRKWVIFSAVVAIFLILLRYLTVTYIVSIIGLMFLVLMSKIQLSKRQSQKCELYKQRIKNLFLLAFIVGAITAIFLWINREAIYNYYIVGHLVGEERYIRLREQGIFNAWDFIRYYPNSFWKEHLGFPAIYLISFLLLILLAFRIQNRKQISSIVLPKLSSTLGETALFLGICILVPLTILTIDVSKSPIAIGITIVPFIWLVLCALVVLTKKGREKSLKVMWFLAGVAFLYGLGNYLYAFGRHVPLYYQDKASTITKMNQDIGDYIISMQWKNPQVATDQRLSYINAYTVSVLTYEKRHVWLDVQAARLGGSIFTIKESEAINALKKSDIFVFNLGEYPVSSYPFDNDMRQIRPKLRELADQQFIRLGDYDFYDSTYRVYARPDFSMDGASGDWITAQGMVVKIPNQVAKIADKIELSGTFNPNWLSPKTKIYATFQNAAGQKISLDAKMNLSGDRYLIQCNLPQNWFGEALRIQFTFSDYFIPKKLGINEDERKLVIMAPTEKRVILKK